MSDDKNGTTTAPLEFHPLAEPYALLEGEELQALADSIKEQGYQASDPVILYEGRILEGRNRYRAAILAGVEPVFEDFAGTLEEARALVARKNDLRRHDPEEFRQRKRRERVAEVGRLKGQRRSTRDIAARLGISQSQVLRDLEEFQKKSGEPGGESPEPNAPFTANGVTSNPHAETTATVQETPAAPPVSTAPEPPPDATVGTDGKRYPSRRKRPSAEAAPAREPGDDTDDIEKDKAEEKSRPKNGHPLFVFKDFESDYGRLIGHVDKLGNAHGANAQGMPYRDTPQAEALRRQLSEFRKAFSAWYEALAKAKRVKK